MGALAEEAIHGLNASLVAAATSTAGILSVSFFTDWTRRNSVYCSAFAVGLLTVGVALHLIPEALDLSMAAPGWIAFGFTLMVLIGIGVQALFGKRDDGAALIFGYASVIALASHSFLDGAIYAASFHEEAFTGWVATGGLIFHEFPEGVIAYALLAQAGIGRLRAMAMAFLAAAATTVAGAVVSNMLINLVDELPVAAMLGGAAGALIYVLIVHLGPHAAQTPHKRGYAVAGIGVAVGTAAIILQSLGGGHAH